MKYSIKLQLEYFYGKHTHTLHKCTKPTFNIITKKASEN